MSNIVDAFFIQYKEHAVNLQIFERYRIMKGVKKQGLTRDFDVFANVKKVHKYFTFAERQKLHQ